MKKVIYSLLLMSSLTFAQTEKKVGDFTKVTAFDQIDVTLVPSSENRVTLTGKNSEEVEIVNKNGELKIRMPLTKILSGDNISATVFYTNIEAVEANEGSHIGAEDQIEGTSFSIIAKEGSTINLDLNIKKLTAKITNGSEVSISGSAQFQDILINSGGIYNAQEFKTELTDIAINAGGDADIFATEQVNAKVRAGGDILIYGKPSNINQKTFAGGSIKEAK